jgi:hypothetical protein
MKNKKIKLQELFQIREDLIIEGKNINEINKLIEEAEYDYIDSIFEDVSATGGPAGAAGAASIGISGMGVAYGSATTAGMGPVSSPQPSSFSGVTTDPGYSAGGGKSGSGDISIPYSATISSKDSPKKIISQKGDGLNKGNKNRRKGKVLAGLKQALKSRKDFTSGQGGTPNYSATTPAPKSPKIMSWDNFTKDKMNKVTHVKENNQKRK